MKTLKNIDVVLASLLLTLNRFHTFWEFRDGMIKFKMYADYIYEMCKDFYSIRMIYL